SFQTFYATFDDRPTIEVSADSMNWTSIEVFPGVEANDFGGGSVDVNPQTINIDLSDIVAGESTFWFAFRFLSDDSTINGGGAPGCAYAWQVDDVALTDGDSRPANDLSIDSDFYAVAPNSLTPFSQVQPLSFLAATINEGSQEQTNVNVNISIENEGGDVVFSESQEVDFLGIDSSQVIAFEDQFTPENEGDNFIGTYSVNFDNQDFNPVDNQQDFNFSVTDTIFSKWFINPDRTVAPADDNSYAYGNCFYVPNGDGFYGRYVTFAVANVDELVGRDVTILTYRWEGDDNGDFFANPSEFGGAPIAFNTYTFDGTEGTDFITVPMSEDEIGIPFEDDTYYFTVIQYNSDGDETMFLFASEEFDYEPMLIQSLDTNRPQYAAVLDVGNTGEYSLVGFGLDLVPVVDISMSANPDLVSTQPTLSKENQITAYPNPSDEFVTLEFDLVNPQNVELRFMDINGRLLFTQQYDNLQRNQLTLALEQFAAGTYFVYVQAEEGVRTLKISVQ
ncbi:MAG: T9SS type A sorting domain-containing protein, partial [Bacteroidota bacterium]